MGLLSKPLPAYSGPYKVSTHDLEIPVPHQTFGTALLATTREPALQLDTILVTLFYPTNSNEKGVGGKMDWLQRPLSQTAAGYARFSDKPQWMVQLGIWVLLARTRLPAVRDAPLAEKIVTGKSNQENIANEGSAVAQSANTSSASTLVESGGADQQFPLLVFSHGLSGSRTTYSQYCGEIASQGFIVAAIEHRDGSGPISVVRGERSREVDYIKEKDLIWEAPNKKLSQLQHRKEQLEMRLGEIQALLEIVEKINSGKGAEVEAANLRKLNKTRETLLENWKGKIDLKKEIGMLGHSFGGATTLQALRAGSRFPFTKGIALDAWVDPIEPFSDKPSSAAPTLGTNPTDIKVPLLAINSESFTLWTPHFEQVKNIVKNSRATAWLLTLVGSVHISFSDVPLIQPFLVSKTAKARVDPKLAMKNFVEASTEFLFGEGTNGKILGKEIVPGDEKGARPGEGYPSRGGKPMEPVGDVRIHVRPKL